MIPLLSIVGKSGAGKTILLEKLVRELKRRGYRVAVIKHHAHTTRIDAPGKDSARFSDAGADVVVVASPVELARFERLPRELTLSEIVSRVEGVDIILTEGFKRERAPKLEVSRKEFGTELIANREELIAVASDYEIGMDVPRFEHDDVNGMVDFICRYLGIEA
jgi:molybdopterin-guanine dinucleotide biosynthesis protein B